MIATRIIRLEPEAAALPGSQDVVSALLEGAVAAYPTETFYALGAASFSDRGLDRVFGLKRRDASKPLSFVVSDMDMVREVVSSLPAAFGVLAGEFWPGPLTLVLPAAPGLPDRLLGPGRTIALRVPPAAWLRSLVRELGEPLTATSANLSGEPELADPRQVEARFEGTVDLIIDGGSTAGGSPSTIVDLAAERPRILREGVIPAARIEALWRG